MRLLTVLALLLGTLALPAAATFPGANGELFFTRDLDGNGGSQPAIVAATPGGPERIVADEPGPGFSPKVSPDGRSLLILTSDGGVDMQSIAGGPVREVLPPGTRGSTRGGVAWSPDGSQIAYFNADNQFTISTADGGNAMSFDRPAGTVGGGNGIAWSTDGFVYENGEFGVLKVDPTTGATESIPLEGIQNLDDFGFDVHPDGTRFVTACRLDGNADPGICVYGTDGTRRAFISPDDQFQRDPLFSPDGTRIMFTMSVAANEFGGAINDAFSTNLDGSDLQTVATNASPTSWGPVPDSPAEPLPEPPPPATNDALICDGFDGDPTTTERADFDDPVLYAVAVSQARFGCDGDDRTAAHVVLSRDDAFADSLVGAALTGNAPLLFTQTDSLPGPTVAEIDRQLDDGDTVYLLGGTVAVSQAVEDQLAQTYTVRRLAGPSRVETSVAVATEVLDLGQNDTAFATDDVVGVAIARAGGPVDNPTAAWADSVTAGAWTAATGIPTVVTDTASVHPAVAAFLDSLEADNTVSTILLGGTAALSQAVEDAVPNPGRIAGSSRAGTAVAIAETLIGFAPGGKGATVVVINGYRDDGWLFGLPAAGLAADAGTAILLAQTPVPPETLALACSPGDVDLLLAGGFAALDQQAADAIDATPAC